MFEWIKAALFGRKTKVEGDVQPSAKAATPVEFTVSGGGTIPLSPIGWSQASDDIDAAAREWYFRSHLVARPVLQGGMCQSQISWVPQRRVNGAWVDISIDDAIASPRSPAGELAAIVYDPGFANIIMDSSMHAALAGNAVIWKVPKSGVGHAGAKNKQRILELRSLVPRLVRIDGDKSDPTYTFDTGGRWRGRISLKRSEFIHIKIPNPVLPEWGSSLIGSVGDQIQSDEAAVDWQRRSFDHRFTADGMFITDLEPEDATYKALKAQIREQQRRPHEPMLLMGGTEYEENSKSAVDLDWRAGRETLRNDVLSAQGMPPVEAGYFDNATLANAKGSREIFWEDSLLPMSSLIARAFNVDLIPHFGSPLEYRIALATTKVPALRAGLESRAKTLYTFRAAGMPYAEACAMLDLHVSGEQQAPPSSLAAQLDMSLNNESQQDQAMRTDGPLDRSTPVAGGEDAN